MKNALQIIQINLFVSSYFISFHPLLNGVQWVKKIIQVKNTSLTEVFFFHLFVTWNIFAHEKIGNCTNKLLEWFPCVAIFQKKKIAATRHPIDEFVILIFKDIHHSSRIVFSRPDVNVRNMPVRCISEKKN